MIACHAFYQALLERKISLFTGVPDSLLKDFCACIEDHTDPGNHIIAANEGNAVALAAGHYLATGRPALVYMQNSGQGNAINPLTSLVDPRVYSIPMLLLIGWRGEPGTEDEPQHVKQGEVTLPLLETLGIDHELLPGNLEQAVAGLDGAVDVMLRFSRPYAFVVRKGTFEAYESQARPDSHCEMVREDVVKMVAEALGPQSVVVSTTGKASRELFEYRAALGHERSGQDFLTVGSMGHASQIALGIALAKPDRQVVCLDGDGALIMHMGALAIIGSQAPRNLKHVVVNNGAYDSVGGQPTVGYDIDIPAIAQACGYAVVLRAESRDELKVQLGALQASEGPALLEVRVNRGARIDLGRPTLTPVENKESFMRFLEG